jgi:nitrous oxidase accessory protein NosD
MLKAGSSWNGFDGNADALSIGINGVETVFDFEPAFGSCSVSISGTTITLLSNCTTDRTLYIPNGFTLEGNSKTITAVDPVGGHFLGAVVMNGGASANVQNLTVTASGLQNACDDGDNRLRAILFQSASGTIRNNTVTANQGMSGCQEGNGIEVRNPPYDNTGTSDNVVTISGNTVSNYNKNGITANGSVVATITNNIVTGYGPLGVPYAAQNGIQVSRGATGTVKGNTITGNNYTPASYQACGLLLFEAGGVKVSNNAISNNEKDMCNYGKGGGKVNASN